MPDKSLIFTCGDPAGIGPDIIENWLSHNRSVFPAIAGHPIWLEKLQKKFDFLPFPVGKHRLLPNPGEPDTDGASIAWEALEVAANEVARGHALATVTGPINKDLMSQVGYPYPGQTEFFADYWHGNPVMAFGGIRMRVVLVTWHIPLNQVSTTLSRDLLANSLKAAWQLGVAGGTERPRIGVCGLNPHAGENGLLGHEEKEFIDPWLDELRPEFPGLSRTQPSDTLFWRHLQGEFDVVVALYHDQGLAPLKTMEFDSAANLTLGLKHIRTSPDHGTAYSLAGTGKASATSFSEAVNWALRLTQHPSTPVSNLPGHP